jgi:hypothetical protein
MLKVGTLPPSSQKIFEVFNHGAAFHTWDGIPSRVILSEVVASRSEAATQSKDPYCTPNRM